MLAGQLPDPARPHDAVIDQDLAAGLAPAASIPVALVLVIIPVTLALAALIAAGPGRAAARVRPAAVLRAE
jgi:hypothetical protein